MIKFRPTLLGEFQNSIPAFDFGCFTYPAIKDSLLISNARHWHINLKGCDLLCRPENSRRRWLRRRSTFRSWSIRRRRRCECTGTGRCFPANIFRSWAWIKNNCDVINLMRLGSSCVGGGLLKGPVLNPIKCLAAFYIIFLLAAAVVAQMVKCRELRGPPKRCNWTDVSSVPGCDIGVRGKIIAMPSAGVGGKTHEQINKCADWASSPKNLST